MDPMTMMALASAAAPVIGGLAGQNQAAGAAKQAEDAAKRAAAAYSNIKLPELEKLALEEYLLTGQYNPLLEQSIAMGPTALEQIQVDPRLKQYMMTALGDVANKAQMGLTQADLAAFELSNRSTNAAEQSRQQGIIQNLAQRGQAGGGAEIAMRLASSQDAANRKAMEDLETARLNEQARLASLNSLYQMGSSARSQDYGEQSDLAKSKDIMAFHANTNARDVSQRNVFNQNLAQQQNLGNRQRISEQNVGLRNQQQQFNKGLNQQQFQNELSRAGGIAGGQNQLANMYGQQASNTQAGYGQIGNAVGTGLSAFGQMKPTVAGSVDAAGGTTQYSQDYLKR
jgi:hypothetical protein